MNNGILVIPLSPDIYQTLLDEVRQNPDAQVRVDLPGKSISFKNGLVQHGFDINPFRSQCLQEGLDLLDFLLAHKDRIIKFEQNNLSF